MNIDNFFVIGLNHRSAPLEIRESCSISADRLAAAVRSVGHSSGLRRLVLLSTCNRTELYGIRTGNAPCPQKAFEAVVEHGGCVGGPERMEDYLYIHRGEEAVHHLFRVTASLDSLVVGETEITGQVKRAYEAAHTSGTTDKFLNRVFQKALSVSKSVRTRSGIGRCSTSVGAVSVDLATRIFGPKLLRKTILVIGTGTIGETTLRHLSKHGAGNILVCNRSLKRGRALAEKFGGRAMPLRDLPRALSRADIVVSSTAAPHYVVTTDSIRSTLASRDGRPLFLIDLAVPRDIDPAAGDLAGTYLWNMDQLAAIANKNRAFRHTEAKACEELLLTATRRFVAATVPQQAIERKTAHRSIFPTAAATTSCPSPLT